VNDRPQITALLACDLDGTLIAKDGSPAAGIVEALADLDARGARLVVCTGRPLHSAMKAATTLCADPLAYVCYQGALVVDATTGEWLRHLTIPVDAATGIVREAFGLGLSVTLYDRDERRESAPAACGAALDVPALPGITRLVLAGDPALVAESFPRLAATWHPGLRMDHAGDGIVDVLHGGADKGDALRLVAAHLGVPGERIVACGDSAADESLLRTAGVSIAVGDPPDAALIDADEHVTQEGLPRLLLQRLEPLIRLP
jgi:hypothetical protein